MKGKPWKKFLLAGFIGGIALFPWGTEAAVVTDRVPMLTYADHTVPTYEKPGGGRKGFISPNVSLVKIEEIRPDGWAKGTYPISGGKRVRRWFQMRELQGYGDFQNYSTSFASDQIVYRTSAQAAKTGKLLAKQEALVVGAEGDHLKIIYRVNGGSEWKMGWVYQAPEPVAPDYGLEPIDGTEENDIYTPIPGSRTEPSIPTGDTTVYDTEPSIPTEDTTVYDTEPSAPTENTTVYNTPSDPAGELPTSTEDVNGFNNPSDPGMEPSTPTEEAEAPPTIVPNNPPSESPEPAPNRLAMLPIRGDVNGDSQVDSTDRKMLVDYQIGNITTLPVTASGDLNGDGLIDLSDTIAIKMLLLSGNGDVNGDGSIDARDLLNLAEYLAGRRNSLQTTNADINRDGILNRADLTALIRAIRNVGRGYGDLNGDGKIDGTDLSLMKKSMNPQSLLNNRQADLDNDGKGGTQYDIKILENLVSML